MNSPPRAVVPGGKHRIVFIIAFRLPYRFAVTQTALCSVVNAMCSIVVSAHVLCVCVCKLRVRLAQFVCHHEHRSSYRCMGRQQQTMRCQLWIVQRLNKMIPGLERNVVQMLLEVYQDVMLKTLYLSIATRTVLSQHFQCSTTTITRYVRRGFMPRSERAICKAGDV